MHQRAIVVFLGVCFFIGIGQGLPVASSNNDTSNKDNVEKQENVNINCIQTAWGCIDITDPSFRPRGHIEVVVPEDGSAFASQHAETVNLENSPEE